MFDAAVRSASLAPTSPVLGESSFATSSAAQRAPVSEGVARMLSAVPAGTAPEPAVAERELLASEDSVQAGGVHDAYDMALYREADGTYTLEMDMKIEFSFQEGPNGETWSDRDKEQFIADYKDQVLAAWDGHVVTTENGQPVTLDIDLDVVEAPGGPFGGLIDAFDSSENWNIDVVKIPEGGFNQSYVMPGRNSGRFDSEDVKPVAKGASDPQVGAAHEFGHMIGLPDEYNGSAGTDAANDTDSIMHTGMDVRDRHLDILEAWVGANN